MNNQNWIKGMCDMWTEPSLSLHSSDHLSTKMEIILNLSMSISSSFLHKRNKDLKPIQHFYHLIYKSQLSICTHVKCMIWTTFFKIIHDLANPPNDHLIVHNYRLSNFSKYLKKFQHFYHRIADHSFFTEEFFY